MNYLDNLKENFTCQDVWLVPIRYKSTTILYFVQLFIASQIHAKFIYSEEYRSTAVQPTRANRILIAEALLKWLDERDISQRYSLEKLDQILKISIFYYKLSVYGSFGLEPEQQSRLLSNHMVISADGCFKLQRVNNRAGSGEITFGKNYFATQVPSGLQTTTKNKNGMCSSFKAHVGSLGRQLQETHDVTGLFGTVCSRHAIPVPETFSDITKGEK